MKFSFQFQALFCVAYLALKTLNYHILKENIVSVMIWQLTLQIILHCIYPSKKLVKTKDYYDMPQFIHHGIHDAMIPVTITRYYLCPFLTLTFILELFLLGSLYYPHEHLISSNLKRIVTIPLYMQRHVNIFIYTSLVNKVLRNGYDTKRNEYERNETKCQSKHVDS